jgi:hypothetical protein
MAQAENPGGVGERGCPQVRKVVGAAPSVDASP